MSTVKSLRGRPVRCRAQLGRQRTEVPTLAPAVATSAVLAFLASAQVALAKPRIVSAERTVEDSPLVQKLLERTKENQERYQRERLYDYYRRNFREYFDFEAGSTSAAKARGISEETTKQIQQWLKDNQ